jgi:hypothetical protein
MDIGEDMAGADVGGEVVVGGVEDIMEIITITMALVEVHHMSFLNIFVMKTMIANFALIVIME